MKDDDIAGLRMFAKAIGQLIGLIGLGLTAGWIVEQLR